MELAELYKTEVFVRALQLTCNIDAANKMGLTPPVFIDTEKYSYKIINSGKLKSLLNYRFKYPDPTRIDY